LKVQAKEVLRKFFAPCLDKKGIRRSEGEARSSVQYCFTKPVAKLTIVVTERGDGWMDEWKDYLLAEA